MYVSNHAQFWNESVKTSWYFFLIMCASEILPGSTIMITIDDASKIKSISTPLFQVKF